MSFDFEPLDLNALTQETQILGDDSGGGGKSKYLETFVRLPQEEGYVIVRFLPAKKGQKFFWTETRIHNLTNPSISDPIKRRRAYHCRNTRVPGTKKFVGDCILCKYYYKLWRDSDVARTEKDREELQAAARAIKPIERYYFNCVVRSEKDLNSGELKKNVGPKIYSCGSQVYGKIIRAMTGDKTTGEPSLGDVSHPKTGRDFRIVKKIKASGNREYPNYDLSKFEEVSPIGTADEFKSWMESLHDLESMRIVKTADELVRALKIHLGQIKEGDDDDSLTEIIQGSKVMSNNVKDTISEKPTKQESHRNETSKNDSVAKPAAKIEVADSNMDDLADLVGQDDDFFKDLDSI